MFELIIRGKNIGVQYFKNIEIQFKYNPDNIPVKTILKPNEKIIELNQLLTEVLEQEDYIKAIEIRDEIARRKDIK